MIEMNEPSPWLLSALASGMRELAEVLDERAEGDSLRLADDLAREVRGLLGLAGLGERRAVSAVV